MRRAPDPLDLQRRPLGEAARGSDVEGEGERLRLDMAERADRERHPPNPREVVALGLLGELGDDGAGEREFVHGRPD
jgi:hypothetical protein